VDCGLWVLMLFPLVPCETQQKNVEGSVRGLRFPYRCSLDIGPLGRLGLRMFMLFFSSLYRKLEVATLGRCRKRSAFALDASRRDRRLLQRARSNVMWPRWAGAASGLCLGWYVLRSVDRILQYMLSLGIWPHWTDAAEDLPQW